MVHSASVCSSSSRFKVHFHTLITILNNVSTSRYPYRLPTSYNNKYDSSSRSITVSDSPLEHVYTEGQRMRAMLRIMALFTTDVVNVIINPSHPKNNVRRIAEHPPHAMRRDYLRVIELHMESVIEGLATAVPHVLFIVPTLAELKLLLLPVAVRNVRRRRQWDLVALTGRGVRNHASNHRKLIDTVAHPNPCGQVWTRDHCPWGRDSSISCRAVREHRLGCFWPPRSYAIAYIYR